MDRLKGVGSFLIITGVVLLALKGVHSLIGIAYPQSLPGPFQLESLEDVQRHAGFWPHIPYYRPIGLGAGPLEIVAQRRPIARTRVYWQGEAFLELSEWVGGPRPGAAELAEPLEGQSGALHWTTDGQRFALIQRGNHWIQVRTDLDVVQLRRIVDTLLPYNRLL